MFERLPEIAAPGSALAARGRLLSARVMLRADRDETLLTIAQGAVAEVAHGPFVMPSWQTGLSAPRATWAAFLSPLPPPGFHDLIGLVRHGGMVFEGDLHPLMAHLLWFKLLFAGLREGRA
jgi:hypothetical protein